MKTPGKAAKIAIAAVLTGALVLPASSAFAASKTERALLGAVLGGVAGAALGNGDGGAVAIGAVAGGLLGAATGKDKRSHRYSNSYRQTPAYYGDARQRDYRQARTGYGYDNGYSNGYDNRYSNGYSNGYAYDRRDSRYNTSYGYR
jgi:uncharacterized protein YcfJ